MSLGILLHFELGSEFRSHSVYNFLSMTQTILKPYNGFGLSFFFCSNFYYTLVFCLFFVLLSLSPRLPLMTFYVYVIVCLPMKSLDTLWCLRFLCASDNSRIRCNPSNRLTETAKSLPNCLHVTFSFLSVFSSSVCCGQPIQPLLPLSHFNRHFFSSLV